MHTAETVDKDCIVQRREEMEQLNLVKAIAAEEHYIANDMGLEKVGSI